MAPNHKSYRNPNKAPPFTTWDNSEPLQLPFPFLSAGFSRLIYNPRLKPCRTRTDDPFGPPPLFDTITFPISSDPSQAFSVFSHVTFYFASSYFLYSLILPGYFIGPPELSLICTSNTSPQVTQVASYSPLLSHGFLSRAEFMGFPLSSLKQIPVSMRFEGRPDHNPPSTFKTYIIFYGILVAVRYLAFQGYYMARHGFYYTQAAS